MLLIKEDEFLERDEKKFGINDEMMKNLDFGELEQI